MCVGHVPTRGAWDGVEGREEWAAAGVGGDGGSGQPAETEGDTVFTDWTGTRADGQGD